MNWCPTETTGVACGRTRLNRPTSGSRKIKDQVGLAALDDAPEGRQALAITAHAANRLPQRSERGHTFSTTHRESRTGNGRQLAAKRPTEEIRDRSTGTRADRYGHDFMAVTFEGLRGGDGLGHVAPAIPLHGEHDLHKDLGGAFPTARRKLSAQSE